MSALITPPVEPLFASCDLGWGPVEAIIVDKAAADDEEIMYVVRVTDEKGVILHAVIPMDDSVYGLQLHTTLDGAVERYVSLLRSE